MSQTIVIKGQSSLAPSSRFTRPQAQVSWETAPGFRTGVLPGYHHAEDHARRAFHNTLYSALFPEGRDVLAAHFGLPIEGHLHGTGAYEGHTNPGVQTVVSLPHLGPVDDEMRGKINAYSSALGYLLKQDAMAWHTPYHEKEIGNRNGAEIRIYNRPGRKGQARSATPEETKALYAAMSDVTGTQDYAPITSARGARFVHFGEGEPGTPEYHASNKAFHKNVLEAANRVWEQHPHAHPEVVPFAFDGDYIDNYWNGEHPHGEGYLEHIHRAGRPDLFRGIADHTQEAIARAYERYGREYGWDTRKSIYYAPVPGVNAGAGGEGPGEPGGVDGGLRDGWRRGFVSRSRRFSQAQAPYSLEPEYQMPGAVYGTKSRILFLNAPAYQEARAFHNLGKGVAGFSMDAKIARQLHEGFQGFASNQRNVDAPHWQQVADTTKYALGHAGERGIAIVPVKEFKRMLQVVRHERIHPEQNLLGGGTSGDAIDWKAFNEHPHAIKAMEKLKRYGYTGKQLSAEVAAYTGAGEHETLGLEPHEASELVKHYIRLLIDKHGLESAQEMFRHSRHIARTALHDTVREYLEKSVRPVVIRKARPIDALPFSSWPKPGLVDRLLQTGPRYVGMRSHPPTQEHPPMEDELVHVRGRGHFNYYVLRTYNHQDTPGLPRTHVLPATANGQILGPPIHRTEPGMETVKHAYHFLENVHPADLKRHYRTWQKTIAPLPRPAMPPGTEPSQLMRPASAQSGTVPAGEMLRASQSGQAGQETHQATYNAVRPAWASSEPALPQMVARKSVILRKAAAMTGEMWHSPDKRTTHTIQPMTEAAYQQHILPRLQADTPGYAPTLEEYQGVHPDHTHLRMKRVNTIRGRGAEQSILPGGDLFDTAGPIEKLRPGSSRNWSVGDENAAADATGTTDPDAEYTRYGKGYEITKQRLQTAFSQHFNLPTDQAEFWANHLWNHASWWGAEHNKNPEDWFADRLAGVGSGYTDRQRAMKAAADSYLGGEHLGVHFWTDRDWEDHGNRAGVPTLGPLTRREPWHGSDGQQHHFPGGMGGEFTYLDKMHLKAQGLDPASLPDDVLVPLYHKMARSSAPDPTAPQETKNLENFNRLLFGILSPNTPLTPNEMIYSRLRARDWPEVEALSRYAELEPTPGSREDSAWVNRQMRKDFGLHNLGSGGLGVISSAPLTNAAHMAKLFLKNPGWFERRPGENWDSLVERVSSQVRGLSSKTASFGLVWQDPANSDAAAVDRHMADLYLQHAPDMEEHRHSLMDAWNSNPKAAAEKARKYLYKELDDAHKNGQISEEDWRDQRKRIENRPITERFPSFDHMMSDSDGVAYNREFMTEALKSDNMGWRMAKNRHENPIVYPGETYGQMLDRAGLNKRLKVVGPDGEYLYKHMLPYDPTHNPEGVSWVEEPEKVALQSPMYRGAMQYLREQAAQTGMAAFPYQWMRWDKRRHRLEPHEVMHPYLFRSPRVSHEEAMWSRQAHANAGFMDSSKDEGMELKPVRSVPQPTDLAYFQGSPYDPKGLAGMVRDGRWFIQAMKDPNFSTLTHEIGHVIRSDFKGRDLETIEEAIGVPGGKWVNDDGSAKRNAPKSYQEGKWTHGHEEKFARLLERFFYEGYAPDKKTERIFGKAKSWMRNVYPEIALRADQIAKTEGEDKAKEAEGKKAPKRRVADKNAFHQSPLNIEISDAIRELFGKRFGFAPDPSVVKDTHTPTHWPERIPAVFDHLLQPAKPVVNKSTSRVKYVVLTKAYASTGLAGYGEGQAAHRGSVAWRETGSNKVAVRKVGPLTYGAEATGGMTATAPDALPLSRQARQRQERGSAQMQTVIRETNGEPDAPNKNQSQREYRQNEAVRAYKPPAAPQAPGKPDAPDSPTLPETVFGMTPEEQSASVQRFRTHALRSRAGLPPALNVPATHVTLPTKFESEQRAREAAENLGWRTHLVEPAVDDATGQVYWRVHVDKKERENTLFRR